jgi:hypothetical protein
MAKAKELSHFMYITDAPVRFTLDDDVGEFTCAAYFSSYNTRGGSVFAQFVKEPKVLIKCPVDHIGQDIAVVMREMPKVAKHLEGFKLMNTGDLDDECLFVWTKGKRTIVCCISND